MCHSVPFHGDAIRGEGQVSGVALDGISAGSAQRVEFVRELLDGVDRALLAACHVARHINHALQIFVINARLDRAALHSSQLAERDHGASCGDQTNGAEVGDAGALGARQAKQNIDVFLLSRLVRQSHHRAAERQAQRLRHLLRVDAIQRCLLFVHHKAIFGLGVFPMQSTSNTPGVSLNLSRICRATSICCA